MQNTAAGSLEMDGTQSYTFTLIGLGTSMDINTSTGTVATQAGLAVTTFGGSPSFVFGSLPYGHYAIKVQLVVVQFQQSSYLVIHYYVYILQNAVNY